MNQVPHPGPAGTRSHHTKFFATGNWGQWFVHPSYSDLPKDHYILHTKFSLFCFIIRRAMNLFSINLSYQLRNLWLRSYRKFKYSCTLVHTNGKNLQSILRVVNPPSSCSSKVRKLGIPATLILQTWPHFLYGHFPQTTLLKLIKYLWLYNFNIFVGISSP